MNKKYFRLFEVASMLIGTSVGAGILGIPYSLSRVGLLPGVILMIIIAVVTVILQLMFAEITLRTSHKHQIPGYGDIFLGHPIKKISFLIGVLAGYGTLLAYIIGEGQVLSALFGGNSFWWSLIFLFIGSLILYDGLNTVMLSEAFMAIGMFAIVVLLGFYVYPHIQITNLSYWNFSGLANPYGVLLFAFSSSAVIPQMREEMKKREHDFPKTIIIANIAVFIIYLLFTVFVLGVTGIESTQIASVGLGNKLGSSAILLGNLLALVTIGTSFLTISFAMRAVFEFDYKMPRFKAIFLTFSIPLALFLLGARNFIIVISLVGGVLLGIQSIIIILTFWRAQERSFRHPEFHLGRLYIVGSLLIFVFIIGALVTLGVI